MMGYYLLDHRNPQAERFGGFWGYPAMSTEPHSVVIHTTESLADLDGPDTGAENVAHWFATNNTVASYHTLVDSDSTVDCLPAGLDSAPFTAFHAAGYNSGFLGLSFAMRADSWPVLPGWWAAAILARGADVVAAWCKRWSVPVVARSKAEIDAGLRGITGHGILDPANRSDPGSGFPWPHFIQLVAERVADAPATATEDDDMAQLIQTPDGTVWSTDGVTACRISSPATLAMLRKIKAVPAAPEWGTKVSMDEAGDLLVAAGNGGMLPLRTVLAMIAAQGKA